MKKVAQIFPIFKLLGVGLRLLVAGGNFLCNLLRVFKMHIMATFHCPEQF